MLAKFSVNDERLLSRRNELRKELVELGFSRKVLESEKIMKWNLHYVSLLVSLEDGIFEWGKDQSPKFYTCEDPTARTCSAGESRRWIQRSKNKDKRCYEKRYPVVKAGQRKLFKLSEDQNGKGYFDEDAENREDYCDPKEWEDLSLEQEEDFEPCFVFLLLLFLALFLVLFWHFF